MNAVGAYDQGGDDARTVREMQLDARTVLIDAYAPATEVHPFAPQPLGQGLVKRDAVHAIPRRAERHLVRKIPARPIGWSMMISPLSQRRMTSAEGMTETASTCFSDPRPPKLPCAVGRSRQTPAPDLAHLQRLLIQLEADSTLAQSEREHQSADSATHDGYLELGH